MFLFIGKDLQVREVYWQQIIACRFSTHLMPSMTLGPGTWGGSIISENVTAEHMMNVKTLAFESRPLNTGSSVASFESSSTKTSGDSFVERIEERLRARAGNPDVDPFNIIKKDPDKVRSFLNAVKIEKIEAISKEFEKLKPALKNISSDQTRNVQKRICDSISFINNERRFTNLCK